MARQKYPPYQRIASTTELRQLYEEAVGEIKDYKAAVNMSNHTARGLAKEKETFKQQAKVASKQVLTLTKKQKAASEAKKAGYWSGASTIGITILYETWKVVGFPGGHKWMDWWNHEAVYGVRVWLATCTFAWIYKSSHKD